MPTGVPLITSGVYGVEYFEYPDGYGEAWQPDAVSCSRLCAVEWNLRFKFVLDMIGWADEDLDPDTGRIVRHTPEVHPWFPDMFVRSCVLRDRQGVPNQDALGRITFDERDAEGDIIGPGGGDGSGWAVYEVNYFRPNYSIKNDSDIFSELERYVIRNYRTSQQMLTLPSQAFQFGSVADGVPASIADSAIPGDQTRPFGTMQLIYDWIMVPEPPWSVVRDQLGRVNQFSFDTEYGDWPAETLLFESAEFTPKQHASADYLWDVRYVFTFRADGWNRFYSRTENNFYKVVARNPGMFPPYRNDGDFNSLFYS